MKRSCIFLVVLCILGVIVFTVGPAFAPFPPPTHGCTPGYWKNHLEAWNVFSPSMTLGEVFQYFYPEDPFNPGWVWPAEIIDLFNNTLMDALEYPGGPGLYGGARIMFRHAVAALLNAAHPDVNSLTIDSVIIEVRHVLYSPLDRDEILMLAGVFEYLNELGCPLNNNTAKGNKKIKF